jgi:ribulose-phosphate 3-epimerase
MQVFGGILVAGHDEFQIALERLQGKVDGIHVDLADKRYVDNLTLPLKEMYLPQDVYCELHMMVREPENYFEEVAKCGFRRVIVHLDSLKYRQKEYVWKIVAQIHNLGMEVLLSFKVGEDIVDDAHVLDVVDGVQVMAVELGFSGGSFVASQVEVMRRFRSQYSDKYLEVDGGINENSIKNLEGVGVDAVVSTSYLGKNGSIGEAVKILKGALI